MSFCYFLSHLSVLLGHKSLKPWQRDPSTQLENKTLWSSPSSGLLSWSNLMQLLTEQKHFHVLRLSSMFGIGMCVGLQRAHSQLPPATQRETFMFLQSSVCYRAGVREHHSSFTRSLMNMYPQVTLLTVLANPDQTGGEHTWKPSQNADAASHVVDEGSPESDRWGNKPPWLPPCSPPPLIAPRCTDTSWRVTTLTACRLDANEHSAGDRLFTPALFTQRFIRHQFTAEHLSQHLSRAAWNWKLVMMSIL